jgi:hypothetical protein
MRVISPEINPAKQFGIIVRIQRLFSIWLMPAFRKVRHKQLCLGLTFKVHDALLKALHTLHMLILCIPTLRIYSLNSELPIRREVLQFLAQPGKSGEKRQHKACASDMLTPLIPEEAKDLERDDAHFTKLPDTINRDLRTFLSYWAGFRGLPPSLQLDPQG